MKPTDDNWPNIDDEVFDLLVDGELGKPARRDLLVRLDHTPSGWRRCAMAFLEAQCWRQECSDEARTPAREPPARKTSVRRSFPFTGGGTVLAMAASFLIALGLGLVARDMWRKGPATDAGPARVATATAPDEEPYAEPKRPDEGPASNLQRPDSPSSPWQVVTVNTSGLSGGAGGKIRVPAMESDTLDEAWLRSLPAAMPQRVRQALQRTGHQVHQRRQLVPLPMKDGRRLVVPVDQFEVHYVGNPAYQ